MSFLTIPSQEGLFTTIKTDKSAEKAESTSPDREEINDDEDEDDDSNNVRLIPRCSPVPRKRGASIFDETAEYMRIHLALSARKRVSFSDTTGGDLVDVKEFYAFDSDDEDAAARWEEEEAKYRKPLREPTYHVHPEFHAPADHALLQAVRANKVEVEKMSPVENEPLAVSGLIRVLNVSFHKAVYIRSTMDSWVSYFDHPAEYVDGSHDGSTDQFSFKLSFAPPYITHGSRIEFVVRYETSDGDYWANNSSMNYVVTLLLTYEDDSAQTSSSIHQKKGILKPPKDYSTIDQFDSEDELEKEKDEVNDTKSELVKPIAVCPVVVQPKIDIEIAGHPSGPSVPPKQEPPSADGTLSTHPASPGELSPCVSSESVPSFVPCASESDQPYKPELHCELGERTSEHPVDCSPSTALPAPACPLLHESRPRPGSSQEIPPLETSIEPPPTTEAENLWQATEEDVSSDSSSSHPESVSAPSVTQGFEQEAAVGLNEPAEGLSGGSTDSAAHQKNISPTLSSPMVERQTYLEAEGETPLSPELTGNPSVSPGAAEVSHNVAPQSASAGEEEEGAIAQSPSDTPLEDLAERPQSEDDVSGNLMPSVVFLSGVVSLSIALQEPGALFLIGLLLVLRRL